MKKETPNWGLLFLLKKEMSCMAKNIVYRMAFPKKVRNERELKDVYNDWNTSPRDCVYSNCQTNFL